MNDNKARDIFYGVVAVATLIVALVGATLAYFSITVNSSEGAVNATAAFVSIDYSDGQQVSAAADKLIPATLSVVQNAYEKAMESADEDLEGNLCTDTNGKQVCSIYRFTVKSDEDKDFTATLNTELNEFKYLSYAVRDVTDNDWLILSNGSKSLNIAKCGTDEEEVGACFSTEDSIKTYSTNPKAINSVFGYQADSKPTSKTIGNTARTYDIVLFIEENNDNQNIDQGKKFNGTIYVQLASDESGYITGQW